MTSYHQIADQIRTQIDNGTYPVGTNLPSVLQLRQDYGVARDTILRAINKLAEEGRVIPERGRGTRVRDTSNADLANRFGADTPQGWKAQTGGTDEVTETAWESADADIAYLLSIEPGSPVIRRVRHYTKGGGLAQVSEQWFPEHVVRAIADNGGGDLADLESEANKPDTGKDIYERMIDAGFDVDTEKPEEIATARAAAADEREVLQLPPGVPVLITDRTTFTKDDQPVETLHAVGASDRMSAGYNVRPRK